MPSHSFDETLGARLADYRRGLGISQEYLAGIMRRDQTFVSKVENGRRSLPVVEFIRWTQALNLDDAEILKLLRNLKAHEK